MEKNRIKKNMLAKDAIRLYKDEDLAIEAFKEYRLQKGILCKKCGGSHHYWLASKQQFQCKTCRFRTTLQSGTLLEGSKLPISYFFLALYLLKNSQRDLSVAEFQIETGHKYSEPLYDFLRKVKVYLKTEDQNSILITFLEVASASLHNSSADNL
ncbi:transposase [Dyadobacter chenhuakuii]|uniref:Transposase n=1 Tax=Dyadobacter chenhuakuii TaxID=2909339 RepID=A0ABY4XR81_9BACT|nr:transposase [Dyadobacter chenhuakuii]MCF2492862.1 transposase [Dyadobacter chenhuakuii]USJ32848.1 transposase [Dyadobacter chenhuakuii]